MHASHLLSIRLIKNLNLLLVPANKTTQKVCRLILQRCLCLIVHGMQQVGFWDSKTHATQHAGSAHNKDQCST